MFAELVITDIAKKNDRTYVRALDLQHGSRLSFTTNHPEQFKPGQVWRAIVTIGVRESRKHPGEYETRVTVLPTELLR
jgi:hypothetical protein